MIKPESHGKTMQATQVIETQKQVAATHLKPLPAGGRNGSPPAGNNYQIARRGVADRVKRSVPVRVASAFPGRIRLQMPGGSCRGGARLQALAAQLALLPSVGQAEVVPDANSIIVRYAAVERDLAAVLADITAITGAARSRPEPLEGAEPPAGPGSEDLCALVGPVLKRLPAYVRLGWMLAKEPGHPVAAQDAALSAPPVLRFAGQSAAQSIPVLGFVDEAVWFLVGTRQALAHCPPPWPHATSPGCTLPPGNWKRT
jgi:hypothetical protein